MTEDTKDGGAAAGVECSLVVPVYRSEETIPALVDAVADLARRVGARFEAVFVVDGSPDRSHALLGQRLARAPFASQLVCLSRNFGAFEAVRAGLTIARGAHVAVMSADLQEPPDLLLAFFQALRAEPVDVVVGVRRQRQDPPAALASSGLFWWLYRRLVQPDMPAGGIDVFACNREARAALLRLREAHSSLVGQLVWLGFRRKEVPYVRQPRAAGASAWTFRKKVRYLLDSLFAFTDLPITLLAATGALGVCASLAVGLGLLVARLTGAVAVPGDAPLLLAIALSTSALLLGLGVVGSYVWRTYENTKQRPLFVSMTREEFAGVGEA